MSSVFNQTSKNFEMIVIDGGSDDSTLRVINNNLSSISYWISEKDQGIYDAMNKGVDRAKGDWLLFLNAGDIFANEDVIFNIFSQKHISDSDVLYGNHIVDFRDFRGLRKRKAGNVRDLKLGSQFCHQSVLIKRGLLIENKYNSKNRIGADFEFFYEMYLRNKKFTYLNSTISIILNGGLSDVQQIDTIKSWRDVIKRNKVDNTILVRAHYRKYIFITYLKQFLKKMFL